MVKVQIVKDKFCSNIPRSVSIGFPPNAIFSVFQTNYLWNDQHNCLDRIRDLHILHKVMQGLSGFLVLTIDCGPSIFQE